MRELAVFSKYKVKIRSNPIFCQKKRPPRANPRRSENPLFMQFISDYSMIVATLPEPTILPPSRSDLAVSRNLFVTVFAVCDSFYGYFTYYFYFFRGKCCKFVSRIRRNTLCITPLVSASEQHHFRPPWRYCSMDDLECKLILCEIRSAFVD